MLHLLNHRIALHTLGTSAALCVAWAFSAHAVAAPQHTGSETSAQSSANNIDPLAAFLQDVDSKRNSDPAHLENPLALNHSDSSTPAISMAEEVALPSVYTSPSEKVFNTAIGMLGTPYVWGGNSKKQGFDCSGLVKAVYKQALAINLPRSAAKQAKSDQLTAISKAELQPGDLVFFNTRGHRYSHVGVYLGDKQFMHAPRRGKNVRIDSIGKRYWSKRFTGARRAIAALPVAPTETLYTPIETNSAVDIESLPIAQPIETLTPQSLDNDPATDNAVSITAGERS